MQRSNFMTNSLVNNTNKTKTFQELLTSMRGQIEMAIPKHMTADRMLRIALTAYNSNPKLRKCDSISILAAVMNSVQLGLEPNTSEWNQVKDVILFESSFRMIF